MSRGSDDWGRIVVGVDGSETGRMALLWALEEARVRRAECVLVHAWSSGATVAVRTRGDALSQNGPDAKDAQWLLDAELNIAAASGVPAKGMLIEGSPISVLVESSADADLLVLGACRRDEMATAEPGSVSAGCIHRSGCPVVVIPRSASE